MKSLFYKSILAGVLFGFSFSGLFAQTPISSFEDLDTIVRNALIEGNTGGEYYLTQDIEIPEGTEWLPLGMKPDFSGTVGDPIAIFTGTFDGKGYSIKGLKITAGKNFTGLFGRLSGTAVIKNLGLEDVDITGGTPTGALAGTAFKQGTVDDKGTTIENVFVTGTVKGGSEVGGLVGRINNSPENIIVNCYVNAVVEATRANNAYAGGLVGCMNTGQRLSVKNCYVAGSIKAVHYAGGILGYINNNNANTKFNSDACAVITSEIDAPNKALFFHKGSHKGTPGSITGCYARNDIAGLTDPEEGTLEEPAVFVTQDFYQTILGWDFDYVWTIQEGAGYPTLDLRDVPAPGPVAISTFDELNTLIRDNMDGEYYLTQDIEIPEGTEWTPFGKPENWDGNLNKLADFTGVLDGRGFSIKSLRITGNSGETYRFSGLFARIGPKGAVIKNLGLENVDITGGGTPTGALAGVMFGQNGADNSGVTIENVFVTGTVQGVSEVGGIVGRCNNIPLNKIINCYANATVEATGATNAYAGGLVGCMSSGYSLRIKKSYAAGSVKATVDDASNYAGGILGCLTRVDAPVFTLDSCVVVLDELAAANKGLFYNYSVTGDRAKAVIKLNNNYARNDIGFESTEQGTLAGPEVFFTKDLYQNILEWDFENVWAIDEGIAYPTFKAGAPPVGIGDAETEGDWKVYSAHRMIRILSRDALLCSVYDITGKLHFSGMVVNGEGITLHQGIYIVKIVRNGKVTSQKLMVK